jgi:hypothetical protein
LCRCMSKFVYFFCFDFPKALSIVNTRW